MKRSSTSGHYHIRTEAGTFGLRVEGRRILRVELRPSSRTVPAPRRLDRAFREALLLGRPLAGWSLAEAGSRLERAVWRQLGRIPYGTTVCYAEVARRAGYPRAVRAVASAVGRNPHPVLVPCHRVVRKSGAIGGYAGALRIKKRLLVLEKRRSDGRRG